MGIKVPDRYGFWRCDGRDCPYKDKCWRTKDIETKWNTYSKVCGQWNDYHWFWGDVQEIKND